MNETYQDLTDVEQSIAEIVMYLSLLVTIILMQMVVPMIKRNFNFAFSTLMEKAFTIQVILSVSTRILSFILNLSVDLGNIEKPNPECSYIKYIQELSNVPTIGAAAAILFIWTDIYASDGSKHVNWNKRYAILLCLLYIAHFLFLIDIGLCVPFPVGWKIGDFFCESVLYSLLLILTALTALCFAIGLCLICAKIIKKLKDIDNEHFRKVFIRKCIISIIAAALFIVRSFVKISTSIRNDCQSPKRYRNYIDVIYYFIVDIIPLFLLLLVFRPIETSSKDEGNGAYHNFESDSEDSKDTPSSI
eukprot:TRINITY_DN6102_c0_g1_i1.p1 TRINITY_DN6102_c0_g1~~TRINITY_DN6102_c0_g1_i1.p1  ORF type:complete len:304 (-),score=16.54 TRINITY_DN6102_c0_g1_i1:133-1044(-)